METQEQVTHTPRPWEARGSCIGALVVNIETNEPQLRLIATVTCPDTGEYEAYAANAHLIAAAPDLLAACKAAMPWMSLLGDFIGNGVLVDKNNHGTPLGPMGLCEANRQILDAIAKAEGK